MIQPLVTISMEARDQGQRGSCVAFAIAGIKGCMANYMLSPEYAYLATALRSPSWQPNQGLSVQIAIESTSSGLPEDHLFPYKHNEPERPLPALPTELPLFGPDMTLMPPDLAQVKTWLAEGRPVGTAITLTRSFMAPIDGLVAFEKPVYPGRHAVVIVGYGNDQKGNEHYLICNSWGSSWGLNGHAWIPDSYLKYHASCIYGVN